LAEAVAKGIVRNDDAATDFAGTWRRVWVL
jgi:hypothetical protein